MSTHSTPISLAETPAADQKLFSIDEANRAVPYVARIVADVTAVYERIVQLRRELEDTPAGDQAGTLEREYEYAMDRLGELVDELHYVGVELKDFEKGVVDFPATHDGRDILLCWKPGQEQIRFWHDLNSGYADRQSVADLAA